MTEMAEKLASGHTRAEIEEMAQKLGIPTAGVSKLKLSETVIQARKKAPAVVKSRPKEAKTEVKPVRSIGSNGVFSLQADMTRKAADLESFASEMQTSAMEMHKKGVIAMQKGINAQIRENEKGAAKMESGIREIHEGVAQMRKDIEKKTMEMQKGIIEMHRGVEEIQNDIIEKGKGYRDFQSITMDYVKDFYYG